MDALDEYIMAYRGVTLVIHDALNVFYMGWMHHVQRRRLAHVIDTLHIFVLSKCVICKLF